LLASTKEHVNASFKQRTDTVNYLKSIGNAEAVQIQTIHKCKGLEFHTVVVQGFERETFFGKKVDAECAFFVAISRAKERLVLTDARKSKHKKK